MFRINHRVECSETTCTSVENREVRGRKLFSEYKFVTLAVIILERFCAIGDRATISFDDQHRKCCCKEVKYENNVTNAMPTLGYTLIQVKQE